MRFLWFGSGRIYLSGQKLGWRRGISATTSSPDPSSSDLPKPRLDYRAISDNVVYKSHNAFNRKAPIPTGAVQVTARLYETQRTLAHLLNSKRAAQAAITEKVKLVGADPVERTKAVEAARAMKPEILALEKELSGLEDQLLTMALNIPNDTHPSSPIGPEDTAVVLATHGPSPLPASPNRDHVNVGRQLDLFNLEAGAVITGSSWYYLQNSGALLELALINYAFSVAIRHGFTAVITPDVVKTDIAQRCGFQPREMNGKVTHMYPLEGTQPPLVLSGTAEIPLAGLFTCKTFGERNLPIKMVGLSKSFRAEAGARGADTRGLYRVHQFSKVELFAVTEQDKSEDMMNTITDVQVEIFKGLGFPFRVLEMPTEELGASAYRKFDMEAWMPGRGSWGEISSTSNCTDFQARRLHIRYRAEPVDTSLSPQIKSPPPSTPFAHTLNGTAAAIPRLMIALIENGVMFDEKGVNAVGLKLPQCLQPFWIGNTSGISFTDSLGDNHLN